VRKGNRIRSVDPRILIIGVGSQERGDDGVGLLVARAMSVKNLPHTTILQESGEGGALLEVWKGADVVILIDAVSSGATPGTLHRFDATSESIPAKYFRYSSHSFGVAEAVELARALHQLPPHMIVFGIEGKAFETGIGLSPEVVDTARTVVRVASHEVRSLLPRRPRERPRVPLQVTA
jgi:hydrogenase maturation protease